MFALLIALSAHAVPTQVQHQGRIFDSTGLPLNGPEDVTFTLYDDASAGTALWTDTLTLTFDNGYYSVLLGETVSNPLEGSTFDGDIVFIEVAVGTGGPLPRQPLSSVPFAYRADSATNVSGGTVDASQILVDGNVVIDGSGAFVGTPSDTLSNLSCGGGQAALFDGLDWACSDIDITWDDISGIPAGLDDDDDADTLASLACSNALIAKYDATNSRWTCATDETLDEAAVEAFVTNGIAAFDLAAGTTLDGQPIQTGAHDFLSLDNLPSGLEDGSLDAADVVGLPAGILDGSIELADLSDFPTELADGTQLADISDFPAGLDDGVQLADISDFPVALGDGAQLADITDLPAAWADGVIDWTDINSIPGGFADNIDNDLLQTLTCADGQVVKISGTTWACADDIDTDTVLDEATVEGFITNAAIDLASGSTIGGADPLANQPALTATGNWANASTASVIELGPLRIIAGRINCSTATGTVTFPNTGFATGTVPTVIASALQRGSSSDDNWLRVQAVTNVDFDWTLYDYDNSATEACNTNEGIGYMAVGTR